MYQLYVAVDPSSNILGTSDKGLIEAGHFLPETGNLRKGILPKSKKPHKIIQRNTLRELLIGNENYTAIFIATCFQVQLPNDDLIEKFWTSTRSYPIRRLVIQSAWHSHVMGKYPKYVLKEEEAIAEESFYCEEKLDPSNSVASRVGLFPLLKAYFASEKPPSVLLIIRPDLYVAQSKIINNETELNGALEFLGSTFA